MVDLTNFVPKRREITTVSNAAQAVVETTEEHGYEAGLYVRLIVPSAYGMEIDRVQAQILTVPTTTTFSVDYDSSALNPFVAPTAPPAFTQAHCVPISGTEDNDTAIA